MGIYSSDWYKRRKSLSIESANIIVPIVNDLISPESIIDLGCGTGDWLYCFIENGIKDVVGVDGEWVNRDDISIPEKNFIPHNLSDSFFFDRKFDLSMSLEAAEHVTEKEANTFVENLVRLAPVVLFSAAIPGQGGTGHVNEQWPSYWSDKFKKHNYVWVDCLRPLIWDEMNVAHWYKQNILLYVDKSLIEKYPKIFEIKNCQLSSVPMSIVHPELFKNKTDLSKRSSSMLWTALWDRFSKKWFNK
ncbi:MAG: class I SAM-dependent methyltransferase [Candidatus Marinimicrobia bacterium]|jgi:SAM-dependent methyltransferase|nr:class I SAM-dependent methyltransferase [Candidatus Neomarinimicrobiota bacterium]